MRFSNIDFPDRVIDAAESGSLVVFAGAGVSMQPSVSLPDFNNLIVQIKEKVDILGKLRDREYLCGDKSGAGGYYTETPEQYLSFLEESCNGVRDACCSILRDKEMESKEGYSDLHINLLRLFPNDTPIKVVTTNFDCCFEQALGQLDRACAVYTGPALPLGDDLEGLVHLHGVRDAPSSMILTAQDYGKAYVSKGWASRFLVDLFKKYVVLFIGYSCGDSLVDYLTRSLSREIRGSAFAMCKKLEGSVKWEMRGVTPISFEEYDELPRVIGGVADLIEQGITDRIGCLRRIASAKTLSEEQADYLCRHLKWNDEEKRALFTREFCSRSSSVDHLLALRDRGCIDFLTSTRPSDAESVMVHWAVSNFYSDDTFQFQALCSELKADLSPLFYCEIIQCICKDDDPSSFAGLWSSWLEMMPAASIKRSAFSLFSIIRNRASLDICFMALRLLLRVDVAFSKDRLCGWTQRPRLLCSNWSSCDELVEAINSLTADLKRKLFDYCLAQLEIAYAIQGSYGLSEEAFDSISFGCSSIEDPGIDDCDDGLWMLIVATREAAVGDNLDSAIQELLQSGKSLFTRIALWLIEKHRCTEECLNLLLDERLFDNYYLRFEAFQLLKSSYGLASPSQKKRLYAYLKEGVEADNQDAYERYNLCNWVLRWTDDEDIKIIVDDIILHHPEYKPRERPELLTYTISGWVGGSAGALLEKGCFTINEMKERIAGCRDRNSALDLRQAVASLTASYPIEAADMVEELLKRRLTDYLDQELCNLLLSCINWRAVERRRVLRLVCDALHFSDTRVNAVYSIVKFNNASELKLRESELRSVLDSVEPSIAEFMECEPKVMWANAEDTDWFQVYINHVAGDCLDMAADLAKCDINSGGRRNQSLYQNVLNEVGICGQSESNASKALVAGFFYRINEWAVVAPDYASNAAALLSKAGWAQIPAWQGLSRLSYWTSSAWEVMDRRWEAFLLGEVNLRDDFSKRLFRLYVSGLLNHINDAGSADKLAACAMSSELALSVTCSCIGAYICELDCEKRVNVWVATLSVAMCKVLMVSGLSDKPIVDLYEMLIRRCSDLRSSVLAEIEGNYFNRQVRCLYYHEGTFKDIVNDANLTEGEKAALSTFLLNHLKPFAYIEDVKDVACLLNYAELDEDARRNLADALSCLGYYDSAIRMNGEQD